MRLDDCLAWIDQIKKYRTGLIRTIDLTGGEPFFNMENLDRVSNYAAESGFLVTVVTNAFWASSPEKAREILARVPAIDAVSFSTDSHHQRKIPMDYIKNAILAAKDLRKAYNIAVCTESEEDQNFQKILTDIKAMGEEERLRVVITFPVGRAKHKVDLMNYAISPEPAVSACVVAGAPIIFPNGKVSACIGPLLTLPDNHPMVLGNLRQETLAEILDRAETNPVLHALRIWGPAKLVSMLKEKGLGDLLPQDYIVNCICDACYKLFSDPRIVDALQEIFEDEKQKQLVAYARLYYLDETAMLESYHLYELIDSGQDTQKAKS
jgi:MoaA/NifB/PqqE/SkfB family radical SAM enzyme